MQFCSPSKTSLTPMLMTWQLFPVLPTTGKSCQVINIGVSEVLATFSSSWELHLQHVYQFLSVIRRSGLTLKLEKCQFAKPQDTFVGHILGSGKHGPDPDKVACVENMKAPTTTKEVRQVLGFFSYFRSYIKDFAETAKPLTELTKRGPSSDPMDPGASASF